MLRVADGLVDRYAELGAGLAEFAVVAAALYAIGRLVVEPALSGLLVARDVEPTLRQAIERTARATVIVAALAVGASLAGFGYLLSGSAVIFAAATVALGFAAQDVVANLVSGAFIVTDRKFNIGDWIVWEGGEGIIDEISFRATRVRTFDNEIITVPNSELTTTAVTNPVIGDRLRIQQSIEVSYDADFERASDLLEAVALDHPDVLDDPPPTVRLTELGDDGVELTARIWIGDPDRAEYARVRDEYLREALARLDDGGVEVSPAVERRLRGRLDLGERRELPDDLRQW